MSSISKKGNNEIQILYMISNDEMEILLNNINKMIFDRDEMIDHIKSNTTIEKNIFTDYVKEEFKSSFGLTYLSLYKEKSTAKFIKRTPVYFYDTNIDEDSPTMTDFFNGYYTFKTKKLPIINFATDVYDYKQPGFNFETLYDTLDQVIYEYDIDLKEMLNYLVEQTGSVKNYEIFDYWMKYLKLIEYKKTGDKKTRDLSVLFPRNILYSYNVELEKRGLTPKIYLVARQIDFDDGVEKVVLEHDEEKVISLYGFFPIDENGVPVEKWMGIWADGYEEVEVIPVNQKLLNDDVPSEVYEKLKTALKVSITYKIGPKTRIFAAVQEKQIDTGNNTSFIGNEKSKEYWEEVYIGPSLIELDVDVLVKRRVALNINLKTASDDTDINIRTYTRIENKEGSPDALNIIKIMSYLGIDSYEEIIKKQKIEDNKFKKFMSGIALAEVLPLPTSKKENKE